MIYKIVIAIALLVVSIEARASPLPSRTTPHDMLQVTMLEVGCVLQGGLCVKAEDCPTANIVSLAGNLCSRQSHLGVECCYM